MEEDEGSLEINAEELFNNVMQDVQVIVDKHFTQCIDSDSKLGELFRSLYLSAITQLTSYQSDFLALLKGMKAEVNEEGELNVDSEVSRLIVEIEESLKGSDIK